MPSQLIAMSHTPLLGKIPVSADLETELDATFARLRAAVQEFSPDLTILFTPDHYNGFFYDIMPPFCLGLAAESIGDFGSASGPLPVPSEIVEELAKYAMASGLDLTISRRMKVDHGAVQPLEILFGCIDSQLVLPIFVNGVAEPFVPMHSIGTLGKVIGSFFWGRPERVLFVASGGLSHDPPVPQWNTADGQTRSRLIDNRDPGPDARTRREANVLTTAHAFAAGTATIQDLNPVWDREFMHWCAIGDLAAIERLDPAAMTREAGHSSHEVRTWLAAFSAMATAGPYAVDVNYYRAIPEYIAGFGVMTASTIA